ncbi:hypothetical protein [Nocardia sp. NPDC050175]|uniref:hypothetical protein n=1 Tax=Nocardia sp. NPDC050175 TaxID=3364317 RepID=UPI0037BE18AB
MNIDPSSTYGGIPMLEFRERLARSRGPRGSWDRPETQFDAQLLEELLINGYLERAEGRTDLAGSKEPDGYKLTIKAFAVINASAARPIRRATADRALTGLLERAHQVETDPYCIWTVHRIVLFGSMLDQARHYVSDVDVAIELIRHPDHEAPESVHTALFDAWYSRIPLPSGFPWKGEDQVKKFLKNRSRTLSLHRLTDDIGPAGLGWDIPHKMVYERSSD